jgi:two-component system cell cycle sensor histidine kinase/response regulator CckA
LFEDSVRLRLVEISPGEFVKISIRDTGPGIDPALEKKVLDPFFTTKEEGKGTGLGLAVVYGIVKQNKGYLDLKNTPGEGLEVQIYFPLWDESLPEETAPAREEGAKEGKRLLLIERAGELQSLLTTVLAKRDYTVLTATTPEEALTLANEEKEGIALYIMNALFQDKETPCLTEALLAAQPGAGLLLMSTLGNIDDFPQAQTDDLIQVIEKPFKISDFLAMVNALIEKE